VSFTLPTVAPAVTGAWAARDAAPSAAQKMRQPRTERISTL